MSSIILVVNPNDPLGGYLECGGPAGGCQGVQINPGDLPSGLGGIPYKPYGIVDRVTESFAGPHDWLSDRVGMYDSMGNGILRTGVSGGLYEAVSWGLIPVAAPFSIAGLIDSTPTIYSSIYSERYKE